LQSDAQKQRSIKNLTAAFVCRDMCGPPVHSKIVIVAGAASFSSVERTFPES
jgi:hypothetical protein